MFDAILGDKSCEWTEFFDMTRLFMVFNGETSIFLNYRPEKSDLDREANRLIGDATIAYYLLFLGTLVFFDTGESILFSIVLN